MVSTVSTLTSGIENSTNGLERLIMTAQEKFIRYKDDLEALIDPMDKYHYLINKGREMPELDDEYKIDSFKVSGCMSTVYLVPKHNDNTIDFMGFSDAAITKGVVAIVVDIFSGLTKNEIQSIDTNYIMNGLQIPVILSASRRNGAFNMFKMIKDYSR
jgi:cysteine desulfuration protein SufE